MNEHPYNKLSSDVFTPKPRVYLFGRYRLFTMIITGLLGIIIGIAIVTSILQNHVKNEAKARIRIEALNLAQHLRHIIDETDFYSKNLSNTDLDSWLRYLDSAREESSAVMIVLLDQNGNVLNSVGRAPVDIDMRTAFNFSDKINNDLIVLEGRQGNYIAIRAKADNSLLNAPLAQLVWLYPQSAIENSIHITNSEEKPSFGAFVTQDGFLIGHKTNTDQTASPIFFDLGDYPTNLQTLPANEIRTFNLSGGLAQNDNKIWRETVIAVQRIDETDIFATTGIEIAPWYSWPKASILSFSLIIPALGLMALFAFLNANEWRKIDATGRDQLLRLGRYIDANKLAKIGVLEWLPDEMETIYSQSWKALLGYDEAGSSLPTAFWFDRIHPDDKSHVVANLEKLRMKDIADLQQTYRIMNSNNDYISIEERAQRRDNRSQSIIVVHKAVEQAT